MLDDFSFLPNVRVDDVMVSYAEPGGSVGPHLDSYDVFLVQGRGEQALAVEFSDRAKDRDVLALASRSAFSRNAEDGS